MSRSSKTLAGITLGVAAVACFATLDTTTKWVTGGVPLLMALWFRYLFQALATTITVLPYRGRALLRTSHPRFHMVRGILLLATSLLAFLSLKVMPVGEFTAIVMITPLAVTLLSTRMLGEHVSALRIVLVVGAFAGTLVIVRPGGQNFSWALLLPLALVAVNAAFQLLTSHMTRTEDPMTLQFYTGWVGALIATLPLPWVWAEIGTPALWLGLAVMGATATLGHFLLILAFQRAPAATLMPYMYAQIGFAMLGGWLIFAHVPDAWSVFGISLIALCGGAGAFLSVHESRRRLAT